MDPILSYLNQIPGVLRVQGYVDDTTLVGDTRESFSGFMTSVNCVHTCCLQVLKSIRTPAGELLLSTRLPVHVH